MLLSEPVFQLNSTLYTKCIKSNALMRVIKNIHDDEINFALS